MSKVYSYYCKICPIIISNTGFGQQCTVAITLSKFCEKKNHKDLDRYMLHCLGLMTKYASSAVSIKIMPW